MCVNAVQLDQINNTYQLSGGQYPLFSYDFYERLPKKPYCADYLGYTFIRARSKAALKKYIQVNHPNYHHFIVIDIDRKGAVLAWSDVNFHAPNLSVKNRKNAHAHLIYFLKFPVCTTAFENIKMIKYFAAIESALTDRLGGDPAYAGVLAKNPLNLFWETTVWNETHFYTLDELADSLDLKGHPRRNELAIGVGRNCQTFEDVRKWSYKAIRRYWSPNYYDAWYEAVLSHCEKVNTKFIEPLPQSEIRAMAKSITKWTYSRFTPSGFSEYQAKAGSKGGKVGGKRGSVEDKAKAGRLSKGGGRPSNSKLDKQERDNLIISMKANGASNRLIAKELLVSASTVSLVLRN